MGQVWVGADVGGKGSELQSILVTYVGFWNLKHFLQINPLAWGSRQDPCGFCIHWDCGQAGTGGAPLLHILKTCFVTCR